MTGTRLGHYEILDKLGEGGMGEVWRARDERLNRTVAVKILPSEIAHDPDRRARFEQEARALAALNHPNIVAVYDTGQDNGRAYMVSELVDGESLRAVIDRCPIPRRRLTEIAIQIADAIAAAHAVGIVHRDLKPENIMIASTGRVKVLDFGLAKQTQPAASEATATLALSQPGTVLGTAGYMSPEQVRGEAVDQRSDIFSFGTVLYEMCTGQRAFQAGSSIETMHAVLHSDPPELEHDTSTIPPALTLLIRRCLEKKPAQRFQSSADLAFALRALTPGSATGVQPIVKAPAPARRRWLWPLLAALGGLALFALGFVLHDRTTRRDLPSYQRLTFRKGLITNARFAPDGRNVVYSAIWQGEPSRVYLATPGNPEPRELDVPPGSGLCCISSKEEIVVMNGSTLYRGSLSGGQMRPWLTDVLDAEWSPDGSTMAVLRGEAGNYRLEYPIGTVLIDKLAFPLYGLRVSPDGAHVAFASFGEGTEMALRLVDRSKHIQTLGIVSDQDPNRIDVLLSWHPNGREIWYRSFDKNQRGAIYAMDLNGHQRLVTRVPAHVVIYDIARDGRALLRTDTRQEGILGVAPGSAEDEDLSCLDESSLTGISDDGALIAATVTGEGRGPKGSVCIRKTDGSPPVRLGDGVAYVLSRDGKWVSTFAPTADGGRRYVLLPTGAGEERQISIPQLQGENIVYGWGADGRSLFVHHLREEFLWTPDKNSLHQIGPKGVANENPVVSPDGEQILTTGPDGNEWIYGVHDGKAIKLPEMYDVSGWRADNKSLYVVKNTGYNRLISVEVLDLATGKLTPWKEIRTTRPVDRIYNIKITPDGRGYAYGYLVKASDLYVASGL